MAAGTYRQGMVTYKRAQRVAYAWHGGKSSPLYSFASTGTRIPGLLAEIDDCLSGGVMTGRDRADLFALRRYVLNVTMGQGI